MIVGESLLWGLGQRLPVPAVAESTPQGKYVVEPVAAGEADQDETDGYEDNQPLEAGHRISK